MAHVQKIGHKDYLVAQTSDADRKRFFARIDEHHGCWLYRRPSRLGYGVFYLKNTPLVAHRFSKILHDGPPQGFAYACHTCRYKNCVNPVHIKWQTPMENSRDKRRDGTHLNPRVRGENSYHRKLTTEAVKDIWQKYHQQDLSSLKLAKLYNVSKPAILAIVHGKTWAHVTDGMGKKAVPADGKTVRRGSRHYLTKLSDLDVLEIRRRISAGERHKVLSDEFEVSMPALTSIRRGETWKHLLPKQTSRI